MISRAAAAAGIGGNGAGMERDGQLTGDLAVEDTASLSAKRVSSLIYDLGPAFHLAADKFLEEGVDGSMLRKLGISASDVEDMGVDNLSKMQMRLLLKELKQVCDSPPEAKCRNSIEAETFVGFLGFNAAYFHDKTNRCYCAGCFGPTQPDTIAGVDGGQYVIPRGWHRYGLKVPEARVAELDIFNKWHVSYHGTSNPALVVSSILREGRFVLPGQKLMDGTTLASGKCAGRQVDVQ